MSYSLFIEKSAQRALAKTPNPDRNRIVNAISKLREQPRPHGVKKLSGREAWRIRVGDYRVIYEINEDLTNILIVAIGPRRSIYRS